MRKVTDAKAITLTGVYVVLANYIDEGWDIVYASEEDPRKTLEFQDGMGPFKHLLDEFGPEDLELRFYGLNTQWTTVNISKYHKGWTCTS